MIDSPVVLFTILNCLTCYLFLSVPVRYYLGTFSPPHETRPKRKNLNDGNSERRRRIFCVEACLIPVYGALTHETRKGPLKSDCIPVCIRKKEENICPVLCKNSSFGNPKKRASSRRRIYRTLEFLLFIY